MEQEVYLDVKQIPAIIEALSIGGAIVSYEFPSYFAIYKGGKSWALGQAQGDVGDDFWTWDTEDNEYGEVHTSVNNVNPTELALKFWESVK
jgi:hypothetical protein